MVFSPNLLQYNDSDKIQQTHFPGLQLKTVIVMVQFYKHNVYGCKALRTHADKRYISVIIIIIIIYKHGHWDLYNKVPRGSSKMYLMY